MCSATSGRSDRLSLEASFCCGQSGLRLGRHLSSKKCLSPFRRAALTGHLSARAGLQLICCQTHELRTQSHSPDQDSA
ncbi:unnamed protein product [Protopolystoma xenopodis]|uniref:Uncharacterized protein n=1 Tax=Protopolystoma xenopodis TaxID=117903 RepID=A0A3S5AFM6_9PLAT|nr:unnamed protein product [Protopolystoma xenopodis]